MTPSSDCAPFAYADDGETKPIAPCGAIANSLFSDTFSLYSNDHKTNVSLERTGIAWPSDRDIKFKNPPGDLKTGILVYFNQTFQLIQFCYAFTINSIGGFQ